MARAFPGFIGPSYTAASLTAACERLINSYVEVIERGDRGKPVYALYPPPGLSTFATASQAPGRALFAQDGRCFAVIGYALKEIATDGTLTDRGSLENDNLPATISSSGDSGDELWITSGGAGYTFDLNTNTLTKRLNTGSNVGAYQDGYFLSLNNTDAALRISDLYDGATWNALQVALRSGQADRWLSMQVVNQDVYLFGSQTSEVWRDFGVNSPAYPFVFSVVPGALIETGIAAVFSAAKVDQTPIWLARNEQGHGIVVRGNGYGPPVKISTLAIDQAIQGYSTISDAIGWAFQWQGHSFYVLTFPTQDTTWVYDATTGFWCEWLYWNVAENAWEAYRPMYHCLFDGKHLTLDRATGAIYQMSASVYTDAGGAAMRRVRQFPHLRNGRARVFYHSLELEMDTGIGLVSGQGSDPQVMLDWSDDGGHTWSNEHWESAGAMGAYQARVSWNRLGSARDRVFRVTVSDPVPFRFVNAYLEAETGAH